jgi:pentatricopeptide repeat protein
MIFSQARAQELDAALDMFEEILRLKCMPSVRPCNAILFECARRGRLLKAVQVNYWLHRLSRFCVLCF